LINLGASQVLVLDLYGCGRMYTQSVETKVDRPVRGGLGKLAKVEVDE
jgi:hypothetical protein